MPNTLKQKTNFGQRHPICNDMAGICRTFWLPPTQQKGLPLLNDIARKKNMSISQSNHLDLPDDLPFQFLHHTSTQPPFFGDVRPHGFCQGHRTIEPQKKLLPCNGFWPEGAESAEKEGDFRCVAAQQLQQTKSMSGFNYMWPSRKRIHIPPEGNHRLKIDFSRNMLLVWRVFINPPNHGICDG